MKTKFDNTKAQDEYQVIVKLTFLPMNLRLTYPTKKSERIIQIEELTPTETVKCGCTFTRGSYFGDGCSWMVDIKKLLTGITPNDWLDNEQFRDAYYKIH